VEWGTEMILALAEKELLNRLTTKTLNFFKKVLLVNSPQSFHKNQQLNT